MAPPHVSRLGLGQLRRMQWLVRKIWALAKEVMGAWVKAMAGLVDGGVDGASVKPNGVEIGSDEAGSQGEVAGLTRPVCTRTTEGLAAPHPDGHLAHDRPSSTPLDQL
jgi:hypothetical protein